MTMTPEQAVVASILVCVGGAVLTALFSKSKGAAGFLAFLVTAATAVLLVPAVLNVLANGPAHPHHPETFLVIPGAGQLRFYVDGLSAVFLALAVVVGVPAALYSVGYLKRYEGSGSGYYYPCFLLFLASMYGLVTTTDMMWFFFGFWELMALSGFMLVKYEKTAENAKNSVRYLVWMQLGLAAAMVGGALLSGHAEDPTLKYDFDVVAEGLPAMIAAKPQMVVAAFGLFLVGFGIKMGMWPFGQQWVPAAYPSVPSPVSAVLSGVLSKSGVYGLMRVFLWLIPVETVGHIPLSKWGWGIAILGTISLFVGTMQGLWQDGSKRLLAYSSMGQIGYVLLGMGVCLALIPSGDSALVALGALGFFGALLHSVNHGIFKALLFLNAGALEHGAGTNDLNKMGGLMKYMPLTALTALVASFAIAGAPLFNGFVSKWGIYVSAIQGSGTAKYLAPCAVIAILTSALTLAMYIKWFGSSFLARTSAVVGARAKEKGSLEVGWTMQVPQLVLASVCVLLGLAPAFSVELVKRVVETSRQGLGEVLAEAAPVASGAMSGMQNATATALYVPLGLLAVVVVVFVVVYALSKMGGATRRTAAPWLCGYVSEAECYRYPASSFYIEVTRYFRWLGGSAKVERTTGVKEN